MKFIAGQKYYKKCTFSTAAFENYIPTYVGCIYFYDEIGLEFLLREFKSQDTRRPSCVSF